jgi:hypothetical protein
MKSTSLVHLLYATLATFLLSSSGSGQSFQRSIANNPRTPSDVFVASLNRDSKLDAITTPFDGQTFTIFLNRGDGTFPDGGSGDFLIAGDDINRVVATDLNGDGIADVATQGCGSGGPAISVRFGNGDGTFSGGRDYDLPFPDPPFPSSCTDELGFITLAHTTLPSLMISTNDQQISILVNNGQGSFTEPGSIAAKMQSVFGAPGTRLTGASSGDYNGDGLQDIAAVSTDPAGTTKHVVILFQKPNGTFGPPVTIFSSDAGLQFTHTVDLNGDTKGDLLVSFFGGPTKRAGVVAFTNLGGGTFRSTVLTANPLYTIAAVKPASIHPVGKLPGLRGIVLPLSPDPLVGGDPVFALFPAQGNTWGQPVYFDDPGGTGSQAAANGDFNADGRPDFVAVDNNNHLLVFLNTTTVNTCAYPTSAGVRICAPLSGSSQGSTNVIIHASASAGALPIVAIKAYIDGTQVADSSMNTLDVSVQTTTGRHTLTVNAWDPNDKVYQSVVSFNAP